MKSRIYQLSFLLVMLLTWGSASADVHGQFTTVMNIPPDPDIVEYSSIRSDTQVNLGDGGSIGRNFEAGKSDGSSTNIEVNISGGSVAGFLDVYSGSTINISGGEVGGYSTAHEGSEINITGGSIGNHFSSESNSTMNISGGSVGNNFTAGNEDGSSTNVNVNISGGTVGAYMDANSGSEVTITGGDVGPLEAYGNSIVDMSGGLVSSIYAYDSSAVSISGGNPFGILNFLNGGTLDLIGSEFRLDGELIEGLETVGNSVQVNVPVGSALSGTLADGTPFCFSSYAGDRFADGAITLTSASLPSVGPLIINLPTDPAPASIRSGQTLTIEPGGVLGNHFRAGRGSTIAVNGGEILSGFRAVGTALTMTDGSIEGKLQAFDNSHIAMSGGWIDAISVYNGSYVNISNGQVDGTFNILGNSIANISDGTVARVGVSSGSVFNMSGGKIRHYLRVGNAEANISGGTIRSLYSVRGGTLNLFGGEFRIDGELVSGLDTPGNTTTLDLTDISAFSGTLSDGSTFAFAGNPDFHLSEILSAGGVITLNSTALPAISLERIVLPTDPAPQGLRAGQILEVNSGGVLSDDVSANYGSRVIVNGGQIGDYFKATGAEVWINSGSVGSSFHANYGSKINMVGGSIENYFTIQKGSEANISGGSIGGSCLVFDGGVLNLTDGAIGQFSGVLDGSVINMSGGTIGRRLLMENRSVLNLTDGWIDELLQLTRLCTLNMTGGTIGRSLEAHDHSILDISGGSIGQHSRISNSSLSFSGGIIGDYFSSYRSEMNLSGGVIGNNSTVTSSTAILSGGEIGDSLLVEGDSVVKITGGTIGAEFSVSANSVVNFAGGEIGAGINLASGSEFNLFGSQFILNGIDITFALTTNVAFTVPHRDVTLMGLLADGSVYSFDLNSTDVPGEDYFDLGALLTVTLVEPGDFNGSLGVDGVDFLAWQQGFGGQYDASDYADWEGNFGAGSPAVAAAVVPEPRAAGLFLLGMLLIGRHALRGNASMC